MPYTTLASGLTLRVPTRGTRSWADTFLDDFAKKVAAHDHTGSPKGLAIGTNAISANAITGPKIRLANNEWLRARNAAAGADINLISADTSDHTVVSSGSGKSIKFLAAGALKWSIDSSGVLIPATTDTYDIGSSGTVVRRLYATGATIDDLTLTGAITGNLLSDSNATRNIGSATNEFIVCYAGQLVKNNVVDGPLYIENQNNNHIHLITNGSTRWSCQNSGSWVPAINNSYDVGSSTFNVRSVNAMNYKTTGGVQLIGTTDANVVRLQSNSVVRFELQASTGHFLPYLTNTYNLGGVSNVIKEVYANNIFNSGASMRVGPLTSNDLAFFTNSADRWRVTGATGDLTPQTDDTYELGTGSISVKVANIKKIKMKDSTTPSAPTDSGWVIYSESGTLKAINTSGTVRTLASP